MTILHFFKMMFLFNLSVAAVAGVVEPRFDLVYSQKLTEKAYALLQLSSNQSKVMPISNQDFLTLTNAHFVNSVVSTSDAKDQYEQEVKKTPRWMKQIEKIAALSEKERDIQRSLLMRKFREILRKKEARSESKDLIFSNVYDTLQELKIPEIFLVFSEPILQEKSSDLYFGRESNAGFGVATSSSKHPGEFIGIYAGRMLKLKKEITFGKNTKYHTFQLESDAEYGRQLKGIRSFPQEPYYFEKVAISAARRRNLTALINDGQRPNVTAITVLTPEGWRTVLIAGCHIKAHEKLSWSYGSGYWLGKEKADLSGPLLPINLNP